MIEVTLDSTTVTEALEIVASLKQHLTIHDDFRFSFNQGKHDWGSGETIDPKTIFYFKDEAMATWFRLTYI